MSELWDREILEKPNWKDHIQNFFLDDDKKCMARQAIDLDSYYGVRLNADRIHFRTERGSMPPPGTGRRWSPTQVKNFYNWMAAGYPEEEAHFHIFRLQPPSSQRLRRNLRDYENDPAALAQLRKAFQGMMDKAPDDPSGYFRLAGLHWLPAPALFCRHHENAYNPWHRAYLIAFEDALRRIDGCEDITLPYWDIQDNYIPDFMWEEPFGYYEFPTDVVDFNGNVLAKPGDRTERQEKADLIRRVRDYTEGAAGLSIDGYIRLALAAKRWQKFNGWRGTTLPQNEGIIRAHDLGHDLCGTDTETNVPLGTVNRSLAVPNFAAFDPLFWFFHSNWDRLWWRWQKRTGADDVEEFKHLAEAENDPTTWVDDPVLSMLQPFGVFTKDMINSAAWNIDYTAPEGEAPIEALRLVAGSAFVHERPRVEDTKTFSVRIKGINRLALPGSFYVALLADEDPVAETYVFQSDTPHLCLSCTKTGRFAVDFTVGANEIEGRALDVRITCLTNEGRKVMALTECGSPTINARLLLS